MIEFLSQTLHGLTLGALFALVAIGYTMVFGIIKLINFAHGEFYMVGGFSGMLVWMWLCGPGAPLHAMPVELRLVVTILLAGLAVGGLAMLSERLAYRPVRGAGRISALLTAVGVSLLLQNVGITVFGARQMSFFNEPVENPRYPRTLVNLNELKPGTLSDRQILYRAPHRDLDGNIDVGPDGKPTMLTETLVEAGAVIDKDDLEKAIEAKPLEVIAYPALTITRNQILVFAGLLVSALALYLLVQKTRMGRAMRAVSHDMQAASLMGIDCNRIVLLTFAVGGSLAGMGGVLAGGMFISTVDPAMGFVFGLKAFIAAVLGGIGNIPGALLGGLALGLIEQYSQNYADRMLFQGASSYRDAIAFILLILVLLIRPRGFFGRIEGEKV